MYLLDPPPTEGDVPLRDLIPPAYPPRSFAPTEEETGGVGEWWGAAAHATARESVVGQGFLTLGRVGANLDVSSDADPNFNAYRYISETWDDARKKEIENWLIDDPFTGLRSPREVEDAYVKMRQAEDILNTIGDRPGAYLVGALAGTVIDAVVAGAIGTAAAGPAGTVAGATEAILAAAPKLQRYQRMLRFAAGNLENALQEGGLALMDSTRTHQETVEGLVAGGLLLGGYHGLVGVGKAVRHEIATIATGKKFDEVVVRTPGEDTETLKSIGAAEASPHVATKKGIIEAIVGKKLLSTVAQSPLLRGLGTPLGRLGTWASGKANLAVSTLMDASGHVIGGQGVPAEAIARVFEHRAHFLITLADRTRSLINKDLGQTFAGRVAGHMTGGGKVDIDTFNRLFDRFLHDSYRPTDRAALVEMYGEAPATKIEARMKALADEYKAQDKLTVEMMKEMKLLVSQDDVDNALNARNAAREAVTAAKVAYASEAVVGLDEAGKASRKEAHEAKLKALREKRATAEAEYARIKAIPVEVENYGHARLFNRTGIAMNVNGFKTWLTDILAKGRPADDEWLASSMRAYGLSIEDWDALGKEPVSVIDADGTKRIIDVEDSKKIRDAVMEEWAGTSKEVALDKAIHKLAELTEKYKTGKKELAQLSRYLGLSKKRETEISVSEAYKRGRAFTALTDALRARRENLKARRNRAAHLDTLNVEAPKVEGAPDGTELFDSLTKQPPSKPQSRAFKKTLRALDDKIKLTENQIRKAEAKAKLWRTAIEEVQNRMKLMKDQQALLKTMKKRLDPQVEKTAKAMRKTDREVKYIARGKPLDQYIDKLIDDIMSVRDDKPFAIFDGRVVTPGRVKARTMHLTDEQRIFAKDNNFLETRHDAITQQQYRELGGYLGITHAMQSMGYEGASEWGKLLKDVQDDYVKGTTTGKQIDEYNAWVSDMELLKRRIMGHSAPGVDVNSTASFLSRVVRRATYMMMGGGMGISSLADTITQQAIHGFGLKRFMSNTRRVARVIKDEYKTPEDLKSLERFIWSIETAHSLNMRVNAIQNLDNIPLDKGIGAEGSVLKKATASIESVTDIGSKATSLISGLQPVTRLGKMTSILETARFIFQSATKNGPLSKADVDRIEGLGFSAHDLGVLRKEFTRIGAVEDDIPLEKMHWKTRMWFEQALLREADRAVVTPGIGDLPAFFDTNMGKLWGQFLTFPYAVQKRWIDELSHRVIDGRYRSVAGNVMVAATVGAMITIAKAHLRGEDPEEYLKEENRMKFVREITDRAGIMGALSPFTPTLFAFAGIVAPETLGVENLSKYRDKTWWEPLLGANFSTLKKAGEFGTHIGKGDFDKAAHLVRSRNPLSMYLGLYESLSDQ